MKTCTKCHLQKPFSEFYKHCEGKNGLRPDCKSCTKISQQKYNRTHKAKIRELGRQWAKRNPDKIRLYALRDRLKRPNYHHEYHKRNSEKINARSRLWHHENRERARKRRLKYYANNKERVDAGRNEWKKNNHDRVMASNHKRLALLRGASSGEVFTRNEIYKRDNGICHLCHRKVNKNKFVIDHLVPVSLGGEHSRRNVATAHPKCNAKRYNTGPAQLRLLGEPKGVYIVNPPSQVDG